MNPAPNQPMSPATFVVLVLLIATFGAQLLYSNSQLRRERAELARQHEQQATQLEDAQRLRDQFNGIAAALAQLADRGNPNAIRVREQLAAQGIALEATAPAAVTIAEAPAAPGRTAAAQARTA